MLKTAILIDGSDNPVATMVEERDRKEFIVQGRAQDTPRNFRFAYQIGEVYIYRLDGERKASLSDSLFQTCAESEADKFIHPEKYAKMGRLGPLSNTERDELEQLRALHNRG